MPMNMVYCRFGNTLEALRECAEALDELDFEELSVAEQQASEQLIELCGEIAKKFV